MVVALFAVLAAGALGLLYAIPPQPRAAEGWQLGPALPARRGELAMAVAHVEPCPTPPCPTAERLYVLGGLSGLFKPLARVTVYDPNLKAWSAAPPLPGPRHLWRRLSLRGLSTSVAERMWPD